MIYFNAPYPITQPTAYIRNTLPADVQCATHAAYDIAQRRREYGARPLSPQTSHNCTDLPPAPALSPPRLTTAPLRPPQVAMSPRDTLPLYAAAPGRTRRGSRSHALAAPSADWLRLPAAAALAAA